MGWKPVWNQFPEETHATQTHHHRSPPRPTEAERDRPDPIWQSLTDELRQKIFLTLTRILLKQLDAPPDEKEVRNEQS